MISICPNFNNYQTFFCWSPLGKVRVPQYKKPTIFKKGKFIAIKKFENMETGNKHKNTQIMVEHKMLQSIEKIRCSCKENAQYFLKYYRVFKNYDSWFLQMENGRVSLWDILTAGKKYSLAKRI